MPAIVDVADSAYALLSQLPEHLTADWAEVSGYLSRTLLALSANAVERADQLLETWRAERQGTGDVLLRHQLRRLTRAVAESAARGDGSRLVQPGS